MRFSAFRLTPAERLQLLETQTECTVTWLNSEGWPVSAVQSYLWHGDALWVTSFRNRPRVSLLGRDPRSAITVSSVGTSLDPEQMASARTLATVHDDRSMAEWFYPDFCRRVTAREDAATALAQALASQQRVIIEFKPQAWNTFHGAKMRGREAGPKERN